MTSEERGHVQVKRCDDMARKLRFFTDQAGQCFSPADLRDAGFHNLQVASRQFSSMNAHLTPLACRWRSLASSLDQGWEQTGSTSSMSWRCLSLPHSVLPTHTRSLALACPLPCINSPQMQHQTIWQSAVFKTNATHH